MSKRTYVECVSNRGGAAILVDGGLYKTDVQSDAHAVRRGPGFSFARTELGRSEPRWYATASGLGFFLILFSRCRYTRIPKRNGKKKIIK